MRRSLSLPLSLAALALSLAIAPPRARAESGRFNLHIDLGALAPPAGGIASVSFDWQLARPVALEIGVGGAVVDGGVDFDGNPIVSGIFVATAGARFRILDDDSGYPSEGGDLHGQLWIAPHVGVAVLPAGPGFLFDVGAGYELSIASPISIGLYVRPTFVVQEQQGFSAFFQGGLTMSIEIDPLRDPVDPDRDHDGVLNELDRCPRTRRGTVVDETGCVPIVEVLVLEGITFPFDSAEIQPAAEAVIERSAQMLADHPELRVEIGGHTDDVGDPAHNEQLSRERARAVADWLIAHGVERSRLTVRGYGMSSPRVPNADDASRARNRRIEFRVLGRGAGAE
jgi:outer membrane protein OmpA-like peptidoglycan-associated protein